MLVISRKLGERVYINKNISIQILTVSRGTVRLGIEAPLNVSIERDDCKNTTPKVRERRDDT